MAKKRDFDAFYYGVGMKLDKASIDEAGQQLEGQLNQVVENVSKEVKKMVLAINAGIKEVDATGLNKALEAVGGNLDEFVDFDPKKLKAQIGDLQGDFKRLEGRIDAVSDTLKSSFNEVNKLIGDVSSRLANIEIIAPKMGKDALKSDMRELESHAERFAQKIAEKMAIGQYLDEGEIKAYTSLVSQYIKKVRLGINSIKASGNATSLFADEDLAKMFVNLGPILRQIGEPVKDLRISFASLSEEFKGFYDQSKLPAVFEDAAYQIEIANKKLQNATVELGKYKAALDKVNERKDYKGPGSVAKEDKNLSFENKIKRLQEYEKMMDDIDPSDPTQNDAYYEALRKQIALANAAEKELEALLKNNNGQKYLQLWKDSFGDYDLDDKYSQTMLGWYVDQAQADIDLLNDKHKQALKIIEDNNVEIARLLTESEKTKGKPGRPQGTKNTPKKTTELTGEKFVVSPTINIDKEKWAKDINDALQTISDPETGTLKPVQLRVSTNKRKLTEDLGKIREAIEDVLIGVRNSQKDEQGNPISQYEIAFNRSFQSFNEKLQKVKPQIFATVKEFQDELKEAFKFQMTVDGLGAKETVAKELGAFTLTFIENLNQILEEKPLELKSNIDSLIDEIKSKAQDIKIDGEVELKAGDVKLPTQTLGNLNLMVNTSGLAQDETVRKIYNLLSVRKGTGGSPYDDRIAELKRLIAEKEGQRPYIGPTPPIGDGSVGEDPGLKVVEAKAKAEEKGAEAVEKKVETEKKAAETPEKVANTVVKTNDNSHNQQIYNELYFSIKNQLDSFSDVDSALQWVKQAIEEYGKTLSHAGDDAEKYIKAQIGLTTLLHQWRYKIGNASKSKEPFRYEKYLGANNKQGWNNWSNYLKDTGIAGLLPEGFETTSKTKFYATYGLIDPKPQKKQNSRPSSSIKVEETAEEIVARRSNEVVSLVVNAIKQAKWGQILSKLTEGLDYTLTEDDFKYRDQVYANGVVYTKSDLFKNGYNGTRFIKGNHEYASAIDNFVAQYENSEDKNDQALFNFLKNLIEVRKASQGRLDNILKTLDGSDIAAKFSKSENPSKYLAQSIKTALANIMGKNGNQAAKTHLSSIFGDYGVDLNTILDAENPDELWRLIQEKFLLRKDENTGRMLANNELLSAMTSLDGSNGKWYDNLVKLLQIAPEFMAVFNSTQEIGREARRRISGTKEQQDVYKKEIDPRTGRPYVPINAEPIGTKTKTVGGLRQEIKNLAVIFLDELGNRIYGFNDGNGIINDENVLNVGKTTGFEKIIRFLEKALEEATVLEVSGQKGIAKDYVNVNKHGRVADIVDANATPTYTTGIIKKTESETIAQQIKRSQEQKQKAEEDINRLKTELNETFSDAEAISKLLDISKQKDAKKQSIVAQKNKINDIQNNIQALENQLANPVESFESIQTQLLQKQEALLDMQKKFNAMPNATENDREAKEKFKEQISKEQSAIARLQERARDAQRTYEEGVANRLIEEQTLNITSLEQMIAEKSANKDIADKRTKVESLTGSRQKILDQIANTSDELTNIKPQLSSAQQDLVQKYEGYIDNTNEEIKTVLKTIKELEEKGVPKDDSNFVVATKELERLEKYKKTVQDFINKEKSAPKGEYTQEQLVIRQQKEAKLVELRKQSAAIWAEEQPLAAEIASYDKEIKFLQDTIETKKKYIESLRSGLKTKKVMSTPDEIKAQLDAKTQAFAQAQSDQERLQAEYATMQGSEDEIVNRELEALRSRKTQKEARIKEIDATNDSANNVELQNERKSLEAEIAQIDKHINEGLVQMIIRIQAELIATQGVLDRANADLTGQESRLKGADSSTAIYTKGGKVLSQAEAKNLLPQAEVAKESATASVEAIREKIQKYIKGVVFEAMANGLSGEDAGNLMAKFNLSSTDDSFAKGQIAKTEYIEKLTQAFMELQKLEGQANEAAARAMATERVNAKEKEIRLTREIELLKEAVGLKNDINDDFSEEFFFGHGSNKKTTNDSSLKNSVNSNHIVMGALNKDVNVFLGLVKKSAEEVKYCNKMFREYNFGIQGSTVKGMRVGSYARTYHNDAIYSSDMYGHAHPRDSMYSSVDIQGILKRREKNSSYNSDALITPNHIYQIDGIKKASKEAISELAKQFKYLEEDLKLDGVKISNALRTKIKESLLSKFATNNGLSLSKFKILDDGSLKDVTAQSRYISDVLLKNIITDVNKRFGKKADLSTMLTNINDPLMERMRDQESQNKRMDGIHSRIFNSASAIQGAIDNNKDLKLFYDYLIDLLNAVQESGQKIPDDSTLGKIKLQVHRAQLFRRGSESTIMDDLKPLLVDYFGISPGNPADDRIQPIQYSYDADFVGDNDADVVKLKAELAKLEAKRDADEVDPRFATAENQQIIIELLKSGIKVNGKTGSTDDKKDDSSGNKEEKEQKEAKKKTPKIPSTGRVDAQADEINKLTNINKDSNVYKRYESMMAQLNDALKQAEEKGDAFTAKDADRIRGLMTNISGLGRKIIEASGAFEQLKERGVNTTEYIEDGVKSLEAEMLNMAHSDVLSRNASGENVFLSDVAYDDVKQRMTYVLTDLEGSTTRVTMAYNEMFGSIVTTADKTTDSVRKVYRAVEGEMTKRVQSGNLVDDLTGGNSILKNSKEYTEYTKKYTNMMKSANDVKAKGTLATQEEKNELIALVKQVETARIAFEKLAKTSSDFDNKIEGKAIGMTEGQSLEMQMKNFVLASQPWTAAQRRMIEETWKFNNAQNKAAYSVEKNKGQLASMSVIADDCTKRIGQYTEETKKYKSGMEKFMDSLKNKWQEVARYLMTFGSMYRVFAMLRQGVTYVKEIDSALTELKKVTDETEESYDRFLKTAAKTADKVGSTIKEIVSSTADWARIGYSLQDAATLAESTAVLLNVSEFQSIDEATSALTSTLQAFSYTAEQSMDVVDVLNEVGNNFAVSSDGIATALKDSASSLVAANNSYEEAVALIASANRVVILRHGL